MSSKEQKTPEGQSPEEIIMEQHEEVVAVAPDASAEQVDPRDEKIANLESQLAEAETRDVVIGGMGSGNEPDEIWIIDDADGTPEDIRNDEA